MRVDSSTASQKFIFILRSTCHRCRWIPRNYSPVWPRVNSTNGKNSHRSPHEWFGWKQTISFFGWRDSGMLKIIMFHTISSSADRCFTQWFDWSLDERDKNGGFSVAAMANKRRQGKKWNDKKKGWKEWDYTPVARLDRPHNPPTRFWSVKIHFWLNCYSMPTNSTCQTSADMMTDGMSRAFPWYVIRYDGMN